VNPVPRKSNKDAISQFLEIHHNGTLEKIGVFQNLVFDDATDTIILGHVTIEIPEGFRLGPIDIRKWLRGRCIIVTEMETIESGCSSSVSWARWFVDFEQSDRLADDLYVIKNMKLGGMV
jgi:hypothetical protein